jgi:hypothetical protein
MLAAAFADTVFHGLLCGDLQEVRFDPAKYPYLLKDSPQEWQRCAAVVVESKDAFNECFQGLVKNNVDGTKHMNVWILGYTRGAPDGIEFGVRAPVLDIAMVCTCAAHNAMVCTCVCMLTVTWLLRACSCLPPQCVCTCMIQARS